MSEVWPEVLDDPVGAALTGGHAHLAETRGRVRRYPSDVAPFASMPPTPTSADWDDLAAVLPEGGRAVLIRPDLTLPPSWAAVATFVVVQMSGEDFRPADDADLVALGAADVPEMLALTAATQPGPFLPRTYQLGNYLGVREGGRLVAMAGERFRGPGWTEISAVCTDPAYRGRGLATRLMRAVAAGIVGRGERPVLHVNAVNTSAQALYEARGFQVRRRLGGTVVATPRVRSTDCR